MHFVEALEDLAIEVDDAACGEAQLPGMRGPNFLPADAHVRM